MNRIQALVMLGLVLLASYASAEVFWGVVVPFAREAAAEVPTLVRSVPSWVWWTLFGVAMWMKCAFTKRWRCSHASCSSRRSGAPETA